MGSHKLSDIIARKWQRLAPKGKRMWSRGHFVVYAKGGKRFIVPLRYLNHPIFQVLLEMAEEEFGSGIHGPLRVPCEEDLMEHIVSLLRTKPSKSKALLSLGLDGGPSLSSFFPLCHALKHGHALVL